MASNFCCTNVEQSGSPDAPNAKLPRVPTRQPHLLARSQVSVWNSPLSLTPSDVRELRQNVPMPPRLGSQCKSHLDSAGKDTATSGILSRIRTKLSKESPLRNSSQSSSREKPSPIDRILFRLKRRVFKEPSSVRKPTATLPIESSEAPPPAPTGLVKVAADIDPEVGCKKLCYHDSYDDDAQQLQEHEVEQCLRYCSSPQRSCAQAPATCPTGSTELTKSSADTSMRMDSQTSHLDDCFADLINCNRLGPMNSGMSDSRCSRLGKFPFENDSSSRRARQTSQNSDIALAADALFDSLCCNRPILEVSETIDATLSHSQYYMQLQELESNAILECTKVADGSAFHGDVSKVCDVAPAKAVEPPTNGKSITVAVDPFNDAAASSRPSLHLYDMRISQHLRSMSYCSEFSITHDARDSTHNLGPTPVNDAGADLDTQGTVCRKSRFSSIPPTTSWISVTNDGFPCTDMSPVHDCTTNPSPRQQRSSLMSQGRVRFGKPRALDRMSIIETRLDVKTSAENDPIGCQLESNFADVDWSLSYENHNTQSVFDGPTDHLLVQNEPSNPSTPTPIAPTQSETVATNYEETRGVWERALRAHQEDQLNPHWKRGSSFSHGSRRSSRQNRDSNGELESNKPMLAESVARKPSSLLQPIALKRVNTAHSFDLLVIPGRDAITQPPSPTMLDNQLGRHSGRLSADGRVRSISQPPPDRSRTPKTTKDSSQLSVPDFDDFRSPIPKITLSDPGPRQLAHVSHSGPRKYTGLSAWSNYPSHTRDQRNGSAGLADNVIPRDFQLESETQTEPPNNETQGAKKLKHSGQSKWRLRSRIFRGKFLTNLPSLLKFRVNGGFRRREHGHRSSISVGGTLEYPELELLPPSEPQLPPAREDILLRPMPSAAAALNSPVRTQSAKPRVASDTSKRRLGSSNYDSTLDAASDTTIANTAGVTASNWASVYGQCVPHGREERHTDDKQLLDGEYGVFPFSRPTSPGALSLPPGFGQDRDAHVESKDVRATCAHPMRRSTWDLCKMLEDGEEAEVARALKTAEEAFRD